MEPSSINRNSKNSPLLRLPLEIRQRIWKHTVGNRFLHVQQQEVEWELRDGEDDVDLCPKVSWTTNYCVEHERKNWKTQEGRNLTQDVVHALKPHLYCTSGAHALQDEGSEPELENSHPTSKGKQSRYEKQQKIRDREIQRRPQLHLLRVCRQTYIEACPIMWITNTFSFDKAGTLESFFNNRKVTQKQLLKRLHLRMEWWEEEAKMVGWAERANNEWHRKMKLPLIKTMKGLRSLHIDCSQSLLTKSSIMSNGAVPGTPKYNDLERTYNEPITNFRVLHLEDVHISVTNHMVWYDHAQDRWRPEELKEWSERLRAQILASPVVRAE